MATSPIPSRLSQARILGKTRLTAVAVLLILLTLCFVFSWVTRGAMANLAFLRAHNGAGGQSLVDLRPWQTAQTLASLAVTAEEIEYARDAERLADHEVDQAFAAALRSAKLQSRHRVLTGEALTLSQRVAQLQQELAQDKAAVDQIKAQSAAPSPTAKNATTFASGSDALQVAQAQLGLDSDELTDAQRDLERATGDLSVRIQDELAAHEASMRQYDAQQQNGGQIAVVSVKSHGTLAGRIAAWFSQSSRYASIEQALIAAQSDAKELTAEHNTLEAKADAGDAGHGPVTLADLQDRSTEREILSIDDDRIQTEQQLASVYGKWASQVLLQHRILLHLILQSVEWIILIALSMIVGDTLVRRLVEHPSLDRRQAHTLRTILEVGIQVMGLLLIVIVFFGPPQQTTTTLGLATAALTIALQDYIIAFLGWFVLVGKNGIRVGDRVEINGVAGEVAEVGLINTTLLETGGSLDRDEPTGRHISFLNGYAIRGQYFNFSTEGQWSWDEITVSVPEPENMQSLAQSVEAMAREQTAENTRLAEEEWKRAPRATRLSRLSAAPTVNLRPSGSGIDMQVRYVTRAPERAETRDRLYRHILALLHDKDRAAPSNTQPVTAAATGCP